MKRLLPILLVLLWSSLSWGAAVTYYVDCNADGDAGAGTSTAANVAWKTVDKVNDSTFNAGDSILFTKTCPSRQQLTVPSSGSAGLPITFGAYGSGVKPIISGADVLTGFTIKTGDPEVGGFWIADAEENDEAEWTAFTGSATHTANTASAIHGTYGFQVTANGTAGYYYKTLGADYSTLYYRWYIKLSSDFAPANATPFGGLYHGTTMLVYLALVKIDADTCYMIAQIQLDPYTQFNSSNFDINTSHYFELKYVQNATTGGFQFLMDGISQGSVFNINTSSWHIDTVRLGPSATPGAAGYYFLDDVKTAETGPIGAWAGTSYAANTYSKGSVTTEPLVVIYNGTKLTLGAHHTLAANEWDWDANTLYVNVGEDPDIGVLEAGQRSYGIEVNGKDYLKISDLSISGANVDNIYLYGNADYNELSGLTVKNCVDRGILVYGGSNNTINLNDVSYCGVGIYLSGYGDAVTNANTVSNNTVIYNGEVGISVSAGNGPESNIIEHNTIHHNGTLVDDRAAIYLYAAGAGNIVRFNSVYSNGSATCRQAGIMVYDGSEATQVYYNIVYLNNNGGIDVSGAAGSTGHTVYNNSMYHNNESTYDAGELNGFSNSTGNTWKNNIAIASTGKHTVRFYSGSTTAQTLLNNLCYGGQANPYDWGGVDHNFADYAVHTGENGSETDPLFVNAAGADFRLSFTSPAINTGVNVGLTSDYSGKSIRGLPDIGAYEFGAGSQEKSFIGGFNIY